MRTNRHQPPVIITPEREAEHKARIASIAAHLSYPSATRQMADWMLANLKGRKPSQLTVEELEVILLDALDNCSGAFWLENGQKVTSFTLYTP